MNAKEEGLYKRHLRDVTRGFSFPEASKTFYTAISERLEKYGDNPGFTSKVDGAEYLGVDASLSGMNGTPGVLGSFGMVAMSLSDGGSKFRYHYSGGGLIFPITIGLALDRVTNNQAETIALLMGLATMPEGWGGIVVGDSIIALEVLEYPERPRDWLPPDVVRMGQYLKERAGCTYSHVKGHTADKKYYMTMDPRVEANRVADNIAGHMTDDYLKKVKDGTHRDINGKLHREEWWNPETFNATPESEGDAGDEEA